MKAVLEGFRILDKESQAVRVLHRIQTGRLVWRGAQQQFSHRHLHLFSAQRVGYFRHLHWYNEKRINISLGSLSPLEYRESLGLAA